MGIQERKERDKSDLQDRIIEAAMQVLLQEGFEGFSIRKLAERIEYSPAAIYLYFKDKDEIYFELSQRAFQKLHATFLQLAPVKDPIERLKMMGRYYLGFGFEHPLLYELMFIAAAPQRSIVCTQAYKDFFNMSL